MTLMALPRTYLPTAQSICDRCLRRDGDYYVHTITGRTDHTHYVTRMVAAGFATPVTDGQTVELTRVGAAALLLTENDIATLTAAQVRAVLRISEGGVRPTGTAAFGVRGVAEATLLHLADHELVEPHRPGDEQLEPATLVLTERGAIVLRANMLANGDPDAQPPSPTSAPAPEGPTEAPTPHTG